MNLTLKLPMADGRLQTYALRASARLAITISLPPSASIASICSSYARITSSTVRAASTGS